MYKLILGLSVLLFACAGQDSSSVKDRVESDIFPFTVYNNFDDFAPIFDRQSDTTYVINFWATWCKPCVAELPYFERIHEEFKNEKVKVILVSLDFKKHIQTKLIPFLEKRSIQSEVILLLDDKAVNWIDKVDENWSGAIPATVVYNKEYWQFIEGEFSAYKDIENIVTTFLNKT